IHFPRVAGYRVELPEDRIKANFNDESRLELTPELIGATRTRNSGIIGETIDLGLEHTDTVRKLQVIYELTSHLVLTKWRDKNGDPQLQLFGQCKRLVREWLESYLI